MLNCCDYVKRLIERTTSTALLTSQLDTPLSFRDGTSASDGSTAFAGTSQRICQAQFTQLEFVVAHIKRFLAIFAKNLVRHLLTPLPLVVTII